MLSFPPSNLCNSKRRAVVESGECWACIWRYFLRIWPATLVGEVPGLEVLGLEIVFLLGWRFYTEIGSTRLPCCHLPGKRSVERLYIFVTIVYRARNFTCLTGNVIFSTMPNGRLYVCYRKLHALDAPFDYTDQVNQSFHRMPSIVAHHCSAPQKAMPGGALHICRGVKC